MLSPDCVGSGSDPVACRFREAVASARRFSPCESAILPVNVGQTSLGRIVPAVGQEKGGIAETGASGPLTRGPEIMVGAGAPAPPAKRMGASALALHGGGKGVCTDRR